MDYRSTHSKDTSPLSHGLDGKELLNELYLDLFLKHVHADQVETYYMQQIDKALDAKDEKMFMALTTEFNKLSRTE